MYTVSRHDELAVLRMMLEDHYDRHRTQLTVLRQQEALLGSEDAHATAAATLTATTRRALGDIARALERLRHDNYGVCDGCGQDIAIDDLARRPATRHCPRCGPAEPQDTGRSGR
ncbi:hypothetical protein GCM10010399_01130 [Dactylosporangium fulvum]|uniref:DksA C4-type domain-containing protein n=1 Tax=Dactylosporangium fulvum TaxID=53359 RepID=A0ABY5VPJ9_9ACTN|nr:hypothetical protein [Dactylosporangium fulvum]UWP79672.1 hypothetical protein Dfulv_31490 [Dactylosporangium fulvum]